MIVQNISPSPENCLVVSRMDSIVELSSDEENTIPDDWLNRLLNSRTEEADSSVKFDSESGEDWSTDSSSDNPPQIPRILAITAPPASRQPVVTLRECTQLEYLALNNPTDETPTPDSYRGVCAHCGKIFFREIALIKHEKNHSHPSFNDEEFVVQNSVIQHSEPAEEEFEVQNSEPDEEEVEVQNSEPDEEKFEVQNSVIQHSEPDEEKFEVQNSVIQHSEPDEECPKLSCCEKKFTNEREHNRCMDSGLRLHECVSCKEKFNDEEALLRHTRLMLSGLWPYECDLGCKAKFKDKGALSRHKHRVHSVPRNYECHICSKKFASNSGVNRHLRFHSSNPDKKCHICHKWFLRGRLDVHMRLHSAIKPYKCNICSLRFSRSLSLKEHCQEHENKALRDYEHLTGNSMKKCYVLLERLKESDYGKFVWWETLEPNVQ